MANHEVEISSAPMTPAQIRFPSLSRPPLLDGDVTGLANSPNPRTLRFMMSPLGTPLRRALDLTRLDPQDAWLPITESRNGNAYYAAFHTLCSGIGVQALILPVAFTVLGWTWGVINLTGAFMWQLYTLYLLVQLHESSETGIRYCRYLQLCDEAFGERLSNWLAVFPTMYLSVGTCVALIIVGGSSLKMFFDIACGGVTCAATELLTAAQWYLVFACAAVFLSQLPNLNSIAGVSLIGAITAVGYCTVMWVVSVGEGRLEGVSYDYEPVRSGSEVARVFRTLNVVGIIVFAFRGHNLILEIQSTMPSSEKHPPKLSMWRGVKFAYTLIAMCIFPLAIGGYWAYGNMIPENGGMLVAMFTFHGRDTSKLLLGLTSLFVIVNAVSSFQIYAMPMFDEMESHFTRRAKRPSPWWLRAVFRAVFGFGCFFVAVAIPFLGSVAGLIGGLTLPVTLAYPCFMWLKIKKPRVYGAMWWLNSVLGVLGMALSGVLIAAGVYVIVETGVKVSFFKP